jgi:hypothetical protein
VQMPANAYDRESSTKVPESELLSPLKSMGQRQGPEVRRGLLDYEVLEAYATAWYSSKLRRGLSAALKALDTRR